MNIVYYCDHNSSYMGSWQDVHLIDEMKRHGVVINYFSPKAFSNIDEANEKLIEHIKKGHPDMVMTVFNENTLYISTLKTIKEMGIPCVLICHDNLLIPFVHIKIAKFFDLVWLTSKENEEMFTKNGAKTIFLPYAANPYVFKPDNSTIIKNNIVFLGNPYGSRVHDINKLVRTGNRVDLYFKQGNENQERISREEKSIKKIIKTTSEYMSFEIGRKVLIARTVNRIKGDETLLIGADNVKVHDQVPFVDLCKIYYSSSLAFSSTTARSTGLLKNPVPVVNLRSFEIPMCGGIQFCRYNKELAEYFEDKKEIVFYYDDIDMIEKCNYYTQKATDEEKLRIKSKARFRAENEHTWYMRMKKIFNALGVKEDEVY